MRIITPSMREVKGLFFSFEMLFVTEEAYVAFPSSDHIVI